MVFIARALMRSDRHYGQKFWPVLDRIGGSLLYSVAQEKHVFSQKCMRFCIPDILNKSSSIITGKIKTHSRKGFSVYLKCFLVNEYN